MVIKEIQKIIKSKKGGIFIWLMIIILAFVGISALVLDFFNLYIQSKQIKYAINRSVKAGALAIAKGEPLADGIFLIDETKAINNFNIILAHNLGLDEYTLEPLPRSIAYEKPIIRELEIINTTPTVYTSPTLSKDFSIEKPTVAAVLEVKIKGLFLQKTIRVAKLSSSQLGTIYD